MAQDQRDLLNEAARLPSVQISYRAACDLELLATSGFSPLDGFMGKADYESVLGTMRLDDGRLFPIPITLPIDPFDGLALDKAIALRDSRNELLAIMTIEEIFEWSASEFSHRVLGTDDPRHPLVTEIAHWGRLNVAGKIRMISLPQHQDFFDLRLTPNETKKALSGLGYDNIVAFQTRNPIHRGHEEMTKQAAEMIDGAILMHPVVGMTKPGDIDTFTRVRSYRKLVEKYYDSRRTLLAVLPLAMRMAGPREALWHAIIRRNYGATHFIVGRNHADPGQNSQGNNFYEPEAAQEMAIQYADEIGVQILPFGEMVYLPEKDRYFDSSNARPDEKTLPLSGAQIRGFLARSEPTPSWLLRPEVADTLAESYPPRSKQGFCVWFTGLSGAGKSVTAELLTVLLNERGRRVTLLDGDIVRTHLSKGLGFSREDRDANILRIAFVAAEIVRHGGVTVCAAVSPFRASRNEARQMIGSESFIEVFVDTPLDVCEKRDTKGMYAKVRRGELTGFTGIDDPYEEPLDPEIILETLATSVDDNARRILAYIISRGYVKD